MFNCEHQLSKEIIKFMIDDYFPLGLISLPIYIFISCLSLLFIPTIMIFCIELFNIIIKAKNSTYFKVISYFWKWIGFVLALVILAGGISYNINGNGVSLLVKWAYFYGFFLSISLGVISIIVSSRYVKAFDKDMFSEFVLNYLKIRHGYDSEFFVWEFSGLNFRNKCEQKDMRHLEDWFLKNHNVINQPSKNKFHTRLELENNTICKRLYFLTDIIKNSKDVCRNVIRDNGLLNRYEEKVGDDIQDLYNEYRENIDKIIIDMMNFRI